VVEVRGGGARFLARGVDATWSPDGRTVLFSDVLGDLYTVPSDGGEPRLLLAAPTASSVPLGASNLAWSPDGSRIRFVRNERFWEVSADGKNLREILPEWHMASGHWTPDGDFFLFVGDGVVTSNNLVGQQLWALDERRSWLHRSNSEPFRLSTAAMPWGTAGFAVSGDGVRVYSTGFIQRGELVRYDPRSKELLPYLGGISVEYVNSSRDGRYLVYVTWPDGTMWRANRDGTGRLQLTSPPLWPVTPEWSPDGTQILFFDWSPHERGVMYTIPSQGGTPKRLLPGDEDWELAPDWSPDGKKIVFGQAPVGAGGPVALTGFNVAANNRILDLDTGRVTSLPPCPRSCVLPRWSPEGRYIVAMTFDNDLVTLNLRSNKWTLLNLKRGAMNHPLWSRDGRFIYFEDIDYPGFFKSADPGIFRVSVTGGKAEKVVDLKGFKSSGLLGGWLGLDPDDNPLLIHDAGTYDIYALTLERK